MQYELQEIPNSIKQSSSQKANDHSLHQKIFHQKFIAILTRPQQRSLS